MKKTFIRLMMLAAVVTGLAACSDDKTVPSVNIDQSTITYVQRPGQVIFHWTRPENPDYYYIKVSYVIPGQGEFVRNASSYADSILIDGLYAKYGNIDYYFSAVSRDGGETTPFVVSAQAGAVAPTVQDAGLGDEISLTGDDVWTDSHEVSEGPLSNLFDGNTSTIFHMLWSSPSPFPHYLVLDLKKDVRGVVFSYICRNHNNRDNPSQITVFGSNEFDKSAANPLDYLSDAVEITTLTSLPDTKGASYTSPHIICQSTDFRYLWLRIDGATSGSQWIALSELSVQEVNTEVFDPENE